MEFPKFEDQQILKSVPTSLLKTRERENAPITPAWGGK